MLPTNLDPHKPTITGSGQSDFPQLIEHNMREVLNETNITERHLVIGNALEAIKLRISSLQPESVIPAHVEVEPDPISINQKCFALGLCLKHTVTHLRRCGYLIKELKSPGGERVFLLSPTDWAYYSTHFTGRREEVAA